MKVVKPTTLTAAMLVSTDATETYAAWNAATAYVVDDIVLRTATQRLYQRLIAGTTATAPESDTVNWLDIAPSNKWAMLDRETSTSTTATTSMTVVLKPGYVNSIGLFGLVGTTLEITVRDALAGNIVYGNEALDGPLVITLDGTVISDWYQYYFEPFLQLSEVARLDLPPYGDAHITVKISGTGTVACSILDVGTFYDLGGTEYGAGISIVDYSRKETDTFGTSTFVRRGFARRLNARMMFDNAQLNKITSILAALRSTPCTWVGTDTENYEALSVFGFFEDMDVDVAYPTKSYCTVNVQGLVQ